jgi:hypothetical protein
VGALSPHRPGKAGCGRGQGGAVNVQRDVSPALGVDMSAWGWVPVGLIAWFVAAVALGLWLGPVLRGYSQTGGAEDAQGTMSS